MAPLTASAFAAAADQWAGAGNPRKWPDPGTMAVDLGFRFRQGPYTQTALTRYLCAELVKVADGDTDRLMIFAPPQEGKSITVALIYPLWRLSMDPTLSIAIVSFRAEKAERWGKLIRRYVAKYPQLGITLDPGYRSVVELKTTAGGGIYCVGMQGGILGEAVDDLVIDDPFAGRAEAESPTYRANAWDWWENNGATRASGRFRVVLMHQRWHTEDMAGQMQIHEPGDWRIASVPAIAEHNDPLGRAPGEELASVQNREPGYFHKLKAIRSQYSFNSIYQQRPAAVDGNLFKRGDWRYWWPLDGERVRLDEGHADLRDAARFITIDLATSTKTSADFTVAAAWAITHNGDVLLLDRVRSRVEEGGHFDLVTPLRTRWLGPYDVTYVESRMFGTTFVYAAGRAGIPIAELKADVDKFTRAQAAADLLRQHRFWLPAGAPWLDEWLDELAAFPASANDDQADVCAYAARVAVAHWLPMETAEQENARRPRTDEIDFESVAL